MLSWPKLACPEQLERKGIEALGRLCKFSAVSEIRHVFTSTRGHGESGSSPPVGCGLVRDATVLCLHMEALAVPGGSRDVPLSYKDW